MAKLSLAAVVLVALVGLAVMAAVGANDSTGAFSAPKPPKAMAKPAPKPPIGAPIRPPVITRDITVVEDSQPDYVVYDDYDARMLAAQCWQINYLLDRESAKNTPPNQISSACPGWV